MTLGTNATLEERLTYAPTEVDPGEILAALQELRELREWRLLGGTPDDVKEEIEGLEKEVLEKEKEVETLEEEIEGLEKEVLEKEKEVETLEERNVKLSDEAYDLTEEIILLKDEVEYLKTELGSQL